MKRIIVVIVAALVALWATAAFAGNQKLGVETVQPVQPPASNSASVVPQLKWLSVNGGGISYGSGGPLKLGYTVGQSVAGAGSGGGLKLGIGFWQATCAALKGDMNFDDIYTSADVVLLLNCTYLGLGSCDRCFSDVNCDGILTSADVVLELNKAFLGLNAPPWCGP